MAATHISGPLLFNDTTARLVPVTGDVTLSQASHSSRIVTLSKAAGLAVTLPAATGSGDVYTLVVVTAITSNSTTVKVANATDIMQGVGTVTSTSSATYGTAADSDTITFNGSTTGGLVGTCVYLADVASGVWQVEVNATGSGTVATPFSATVS